MSGSSAIVIAAVVAAVLVVVITRKAVHLVPYGAADVVERLGRYRTTGGTGLLFLVPFVDRVRERVSLLEQVTTLRAEPVITQDNRIVDVDATVWFQATDPRAAAYDVPASIEGVTVADHAAGVARTAVVVLRETLGGMAVRDALESRHQLNNDLRTQMHDRTGHWGVWVVRVDVTAIRERRSVPPAADPER